MSKHIAGLKVGDTLECKGPISKLPLKDIAAKKAVGMVRHDPKQCHSMHPGPVYPLHMASRFSFGSFFATDTMRAA